MILLVSFVLLNERQLKKFEGQFSSTGNTLIAVRNTASIYFMNLIELPKSYLLDFRSPASHSLQILQFVLFPEALNGGSTELFTWMTSFFANLN